MKISIHQYVREIEVQDYLTLDIERDGMNKIKKLTIRLDDQLLRLLEEHHMEEENGLKEEMDERIKILLDHELETCEVIDLSKFE